MKTSIRNSGSVPLSYDGRDRLFNHHATFGAPSLVSLPVAGMGRAIKYLVDQEWTSWCTGCNTSRASAYIEGEDMSFEYQAAVIAYLLGQDVLLNGADPRKAMQAMCLYGSLPKRLATLSLDNNGLDAGKIRNYPAPDFLDAARDEKSSFFWIHTGPYDAFDNIRSALWQAEQDALAEAKATGNPKKEYVAMLFTQWFPEMSGETKNPDGTYAYTGVVPDMVTWVPPQAFSGLSPIFNAIMQFFSGIFPSFFAGEEWHAYLGVDWDLTNGDYLVTQNSYGTEWGSDGTQKFSRATINGLFADYRAGAAIFRDVDPKDVKSLAEQQSTIAALYKDLGIAS